MDQNPYVLEILNEHQKILKKRKKIKNLFYWKQKRKYNEEILLSFKELGTRFKKKKKNRITQF